MIRLDRHLAVAGQLEELRCIDALERESDELHRADLFLRYLPLIESGRDLLRTKLQPQVILEPDQTRQRRVALCRFRVLDQQRRNQLARLRNQLVVSVDLVLDRLTVRHFLRPDHFLDLVPFGLRVLEEKREMRSDVEPPPLFLMNKQRPQPAPHALVISQRKYFLEDNLLQMSSSCGVGSGGCTASGNPSRRYARASTSIGCIGRTPVSC